MSKSAIAECESATLQLGSLSDDLLSAIVATLNSESDINSDTLASLQESYPSLRFTLCYEQEMGSNDAYIEAESFDLHLVSHSTTGCSSLTCDLAASSGLVIALRDE